MLGEPHTAGDSKSSGSDHQETEWQFDLPEREVVERWLDENGGAGEISAGRGRTLRLIDRYYDTADWRLWRAGYALRIRSRGKRSEATLKSLADPGEQGFKRRREISEPLFSGGIEGLGDSEGPVGGRLWALAGGRKLEELFEIRTRRVAYPLSGSGEPDGAASVVGELAVDETEIAVPGAEEPVRVDRVEVEEGAGGTERLSPFVSELREACGLAPDSVSKFGAGLAARGLAPPEEPDFGFESVDASLTLGEIAYAVMRRQLGKFLRHEPGVRLGEDPEELHDMRVASRRLRAALLTFEPALSEKGRRFEPELKHFATVLGEVRDLDVQLGRVDLWISAAPEEDRGSLEELRGALESQRESARKQMLAELDSRRYERLIDTLSRMLRLGPPRRNRLAGAPVVEAAPDLVRHAYRRARKVGDRLSPDSAAEDYHRLRKRCKRLRYLVEFVEEIYDGPARKLVKRLKPLQDVLGELQDAEVARDRLRSLATEPGEPELSQSAAFATGGVAARQAAAATELRDEFPAAYSRIKGKPWKRLDKAMQKMQKSSSGSGG